MNTKGFMLRLPAGLKQTAETAAAADGVSLNQWVALAVAEKISALETAGRFAPSGPAPDRALLDRLLKR